MTDNKQQKNNSISYESALLELTELVDIIGSEDCPIDQLENKVKRAAELIKLLRERLNRTEMIVKEVIKDLEQES